MRIWLITTGEPLPTDGPNERLLRTGILAGGVARSGHDVTWWTSAFDHVRKRHRTERNERVSVADNYEICMLQSRGYSSNVSLQRVLDHRDVAKEFCNWASREARPDVMLCSWPTIELCYEATRLGSQWSVPVVCDVRDMWPDAIVDIMPRSLRPAARVAMYRSYRLARHAASQATAISGITEEVTNWGVQFAGRSRLSMDRAFPMGYQSTSASSDALFEADRFWRARGLATDQSQFVVCFFGTIGRHFEIETVIEAAAKLESSGRAVTFVLCGDGPKLTEWKRLSINRPNVILPGWVDAARIESLMRLSAVGLAPYYSSWDFQMSIPNKPIEYLSAGLPVVSSLRGVLADVLLEHRCGLTYRNGEPNDLVRKLSSCYDHPTFRAEMSENAACLFRQRFTAEAVYAEMQEYLLGIAADSHRVKAA